MRFEQIRILDDERFRRLTGVKRTTFNKMAEEGTRRKEEQALY
jgi:hypothetical protein